MISLTYLYHSGFLLQLRGRLNIVFDYWKESSEPAPLRTSRREEPDFLNLMSREIPLYVFISHHHKDHFNPDVFKWSRDFDKVTYIISKDVATFSRHLVKERDDVVILTPGKKWENHEIKVSAYPSTDIGNSYAVEIPLQDGQPLKVFHAGDLNAWLWLDESTEEEISQMKTNFLKAIEQVREDYPRLDIAMFPVDSRQGRGYEKGAAWFLEKISVDRFFPMHFELWENEEERKRYLRDATRFESYMSRQTGECIALTSPGARWVCRSGNIFPLSFQR